MDLQFRKEFKKENLPRAWHIFRISAATAARARAGEDHRLVSFAAICRDRPPAVTRRHHSPLRGLQGEYQYLGAAGPLASLCSCSFFNLRQRVYCSCPPQIFDGAAGSYFVKALTFLKFRSGSTAGSIIPRLF